MTAHPQTISSVRRLESSQPIVRSLHFVLMALLLSYALLAGLRTVSDFDLGWQLATGRWVAQHHTIPSVDVFSYTAAGKPWIYPALSCLVFYGAYSLGGYALLSWLGALACTGTAALLLRQNSAVSSMLLVFAIPLIAIKTAPRADMFTVVLFAAFLHILWTHHERGSAPLWMLPVLMALWVNLHLGFLSGLAVLGAYILVEMLAMLQASDRQAALMKLRRSWPWLIATAAATLLNPWGWNIYRAIIRQESVMGLHSQAIMEWSSVSLTWTSLAQQVGIRDSRGSFVILLLISAATVVIALWRRQFGAAVVIASAALIACRHVRFEALFAVTLAIIGSGVLCVEVARLAHPTVDARTYSAVRLAAGLLIAVLVCIRSVDLITNRTYVVNSDIASFGAGLSWWFPEGAAAFLEKTNPAGEIFNSYNEGGFVVWRLGQQYRDYIDGRAIPFGEELFRRNGKLLSTPPDSQDWQQESERYHMNSIIIPLGRYMGVRAFPAFRQFCNSEKWSPVYLDETSVVFVRVTPEMADFISKHHIDCATVSIPAEPLATSGFGAFNQWSNAASILHELGREPEALAASDKALALSTESGFLYFLRGEIFASIGSLREAEQAYSRATELQPNEVDWSALARLYQQERRFEPAMQAWQRAAKASGAPATPLLALGYAALDAHRPNDALNALDQAFSEYQKQPQKEEDNAFSANVAHGRAQAWAALGDLTRATAFAEETVRLAPNRSEDWLQLSNLYLRQDRPEDARRARERAAMTTQQGSSN